QPRASSAPRAGSAASSRPSSSGSSKTPRGRTPTASSGCSCSRRSRSRWRSGCYEPRPSSSCAAQGTASMPERALRFLRRVEPRPRQWQGTSKRSRNWESFYRERWAHDRVVRSTHGVNCTGSCSWKVYVKDGIVAWETQQTDYPENGDGEPDYEPRGCPRGASFSWYVYSPLRVRHPYVRGTLIERWREARARLEPVDAWAEIAADPVCRAERGKGGFVRASWDEAAELVAAGLGSTIERYGPDRIAAFSPIPAMSMASYTAGSRFFSLLGAPLLSFYDWYCDLP